MAMFGSSRINELAAHAARDGGNRWKKQFTGGTQMVNKQPGNYLLSPYIQSRKQFLGDWRSDFSCVCIFACGLGMRGPSGLTFKSTKGLFVLHIVAGILSHEYDGAE